MRRGQLRGDEHIRLAGIGPAIADVFEHGRAEHHRVLRHQRKGTAPIGRIGPGRGDIVHGDDASLRIIKAQRELQDGALAGPGRADEGDALAGLHMQAEIVQRRIVTPGIAERDMRKRQGTADLRRQRRRVGRRSDRRARGEQFANSTGRAGGGLDLAIDLGKLPQRTGRKDRIEHELGQTPACHRPRHDIGSPRPEHPDHACRNHEDAETGEPGPRCRGQACSLEGILRRHAETAGGLGLGPEGLHGPRSADRLRGIGRGLGQLVLGSARTLAHTTSRQHQRHDDERDRGQHQHRQARTGDDHHHRRTHEQQDVAQSDRGGRAEGRLDLGRIRREPRHDLARLGPVEEGRIKRGQMAEHILPYGRDDALAQRDHQIIAGGTGHGQDQHDADQRHEVIIFQCGIAGLESGVDHPPERQRQQQRRQ